MLQLNIIIVGAGIAGLSTAIALQRKGHTITVLERHLSCQAIGAPVGLSANATRVLIHYGMEDIMTKADARLQNIIYQRRYDSGKILGSRPVGQSVKDYGFPSWALARYQLQKTLAQVAEERGVKLLFGKQVVGIDLEKPAVRLKDDDLLEADLIVGADGTSADTLFSKKIGLTVDTRNSLSHPRRCGRWHTCQDHQPLQCLQH